MHPPSPIPITPALPNQPKRLWQCWGMSLMVHGCLLFLLLLVMSTRTGSINPTREAGIVLAIVNSIDQKTDYLTESPESEIALKEAESPPEAATTATAVTGNSEPAASAFGQSPENGRRSSELANAPGLTSISDVSEMLNSTGNQGLPENAPMGAEDLQRLAEEQARIASMKPVGEPVELSVFGSPAMSGRKFVFLLDQSDSMGSGGLGVLEACKSELRREIDKLKDYHQFQIVAYNERTSMMGRRRLLAATKDNRQSVEAFIGSLVAAGGTNHEGGLIVALGLEPDVIVLISDGGDPLLDRNQLDLLQRVCAGQTQIHCLQFGIGGEPRATGNASQPFMQRLASENNGSYRYIDVSQWSSNRN